MAHFGETVYPFTSIKFCNAISCSSLTLFIFFSSVLRLFCCQLTTLSSLASYGKENNRYTVCTIGNNFALTSISSEQMKLRFFLRSHTTWRNSKWRVNIAKANDGKQMKGMGKKCSHTHTFIVEENILYHNTVLIIVIINKKNSFIRSRFYFPFENINNNKNQLNQ